MTTLGEALAFARQRIDRLDARLLLQYATGCSHADLLARPEMPVIGAAGEQFVAWVERRAAGEPLAYLVGEAEFRGRVFQVSPAVLIPRPETEVLIELALEKLAGRAAADVVDLGTGSGIVAVSLALECPVATVSAVDLSPGALAVARNNAGRLGAKVDFHEGDWFAPLAGRRFDLIVSNPPYVAEGDPHLELNGLPHEPRLALTDRKPAAMAWPASGASWPMRQHTSIPVAGCSSSTATIKARRAGTYWPLPGSKKHSLIPTWPA